MSVSIVAKRIDYIRLRVCQGNGEFNKEDLEDFRTLLNKIRGTSTNEEDVECMSRGFKALLRRAADPNSRKNSSLVYMLLLSTIHPMIVQMYSEILLHWPILITLKVVEFHAQSVRDVFLDAASSSASSWISTRFLLNMVKDPIHSKNLIRLWNSDLQLKTNVNSVFLKNNHFTNCNYLAELLKILDDNTGSQRGRTRRNTHIPDIVFIPKCEAGDYQIFDYLRKKNNIFRNLYQLESFECSGELDMHKSFDDDNIILAQICQKTMVIWVSDKDTFNPMFLSLSYLEIEDIYKSDITLSIRKRNIGDGFSCLWDSTGFDNVTLKFRLQKSFLMGHFINQIKVNSRVNNNFKLLEAERYLSFPVKNYLHSKVEIGRSDEDIAFNEVENNQKQVNRNPSSNYQSETENRQETSQKPSEVIFSSPVYMLDKTSTQIGNHDIKDLGNDNERTPVKKKNINNPIINNGGSQNDASSIIFTPKKLLHTLERTSKIYGRKQVPKSKRKDIWDLSSSIPSSPSNGSPVEKTKISKTSTSLIEDSQFDPSPIKRVHNTHPSAVLGDFESLSNSPLQNTSDSEDMRITAKKRRVANVLESTYPSNSYQNDNIGRISEAEKPTQDAPILGSEDKDGSQVKPSNIESETSRLSDEIMGNSTTLENRENNETNNTSNLLVENASKIGVPFLNNESRNDKIQDAYSIMEQGLNLFCAEHLHRLNILHETFLEKEKEIEAKFEERLQLLYRSKENQLELHQKTGR